MARTTFWLPAQLKQDLHEHIKLAEGYGARKKSRWIREAIIMLTREDSTLTTVGLGADLIKNDAEENVVLEGEALKSLDNAVYILRRQIPRMEGVQSEVIRAAIRHRLRKEGDTSLLV